MLIDTHCHLDCEPLISQLASYLEAATASGVCRWVVPGIHPDGWAEIAAVCRGDDRLKPAFGIHPRHAGEVGDAEIERLQELAPQGVALGEVGLDRRYGNPECQEMLLRRQIRIACEAKLPLLLHCCDMIGRLQAILREERAERVGGILHAYSGSIESARELINMGFVLSPGTHLLRRNTDRFRQLVQAVPLSRLVLETDAPGPERESGRNNPLLLRDIAATLAEMTGTDIDEVIRVTGTTAWQVLPRLNRCSDRNVPCS